MARQGRFFQNIKSMAGVMLIGFGLFILCGNVADAAARLSRLASTNAEMTQAFGGLIAVGLAAARVWQAYLFDRRGLLLGLCDTLISFWPVLLIVAGAVLTGMASRTESTNLQKKIQDLSN